MSAATQTAHVICADADVAEGERKLAFVGGRSVVVFRIEGQLHAIENSCPHNGASLASGCLQGRVLSCPAHGLRFDLGTGRSLTGGQLCVKLLPTRVIDGQISLATA
ncbi:3-phenylpropionate/trans-cinnamate dioxygenase ferredoxin subunit [Paraburkholderia bannensis]|uniref:3-phenylpropionate/trans-cinnamate dioxygenase ferredoxin subunit n=1 Tax=Paraburkholderia bannensis TaxID=765414 RepID=A0A7W9WUE0_9BURK|nr:MULTISPECIES: Rieske 2Fe-2S domain-containing protein [Paraburkholderia]MBB3259216.1 3-phenylpropionate/trans-cinnamate dioxygenase ferredoxin subunit [Paraburkholderia sp. WP4_3_2]MBB6104231.1 3-phenylpropionate/trans-cinnamate dioxygenase ferredoxin subunit [Paraburkholderia bannensis]